MTKTNLKISFAVLATVRIECPDCEASVELPVEKLDRAALPCPCCGVSLRNFDNNQHLADFTRSLQALQKGKPRFSFVMPVENKA